MAYAADRGPVLVPCLSRVVTPAVSFIRRQVTYENRHPIDEYLFDRRSPFAGHSFIQTSSYLLPRALGRGLRFRTDTPAMSGITCCGFRSRKACGWRRCQRFHIDPHMNRINNPVIITSGVQSSSATRDFDE